jgi:hypothetical protein
MPRITVSRCHAVARPNDRVFFALAAAAGVLLILGSILPTFIVGLDAAVGAGDDQQAYHFNRTLHAVTYVEPGSLAFPLGGAILVATGILGLRQPRLWGIGLVAALMTALFVHALRAGDYFGGWDESGVHMCEQRRLEDCIGFLAPAVQDLRADILRKPIAREREFYGPAPEDFRAGGRVGWTVIGWTIAVFSFVAWFRAVFLLTRRTLASLLVVTAIGLIVLAYLFLKALENLE